MPYTRWSPNFTAFETYQSEIDTLYTWTSDQFSQYGTKVIATTIRDATYVLDEILDNETDLAILDHTTDTAGFTVILTLVGYTRIPDRRERDRLRPASPDDTPAP